MSDNGTAASGPTIAWDTISTVAYQRMKLVHGVDGVNDGDVSNTNPLPVSVRQPSFWTPVQTVPGTAAAAYAAADTLGTIITIPNAARATGLGGFINSILVFDDTNSLVAFDIVFFDSTVTLAADNAAWALSDADVLKQVATVAVGFFVNHTNNRHFQEIGTSIPYTCTGTDLFASIIVRQAFTLGAGTTPIRLRLALSRD